QPHPVNLHSKIRLARMRQLTLSHRTIQHRMRRHSLLNTRSKNLRLPQPLSPQRIHQIARTRTPINRNLSKLALALDQKVNQPLRALRHRSLTNRLNMHPAIIGLQRTRNSNMRTTGRELHTKRTHTRLRRLRNTLPPQARPERLTPLLTLIPNPQALTLKRLDRPQQLPHTQNRALTSAERERRVSLSPLRPVIRISLVIRRKLDIENIGVIPGKRGLTPQPEHLA